MATEQIALKVYLDPDKADRLREIAALEERTLTSLVRLILNEWLDERERQELAA